MTATAQGSGGAPAKGVSRRALSRRAEPSPQTGGVPQCSARRGLSDEVRAARLSHSAHVKEALSHNENRPGSPDVALKSWEILVQGAPERRQWHRGSQPAGPKVPAGYRWWRPPPGLPTLSMAEIAKATSGWSGRQRREGAAGEGRNEGDLTARTLIGALTAPAIARARAPNACRSLMESFPASGLVGDGREAGPDSASPAVVVLPQGVQRRLSIWPSHGRAGTVGRHRTPRRGSKGWMAADTTCAFGARAPTHQGL